MVRSISEDMNCFNLSSIVFSAGPKSVSCEIWEKYLYIQRWDEIGCLLLFQRRVHPFERLRWDRLLRLALSFRLSISLVCLQDTCCPNSRAIRPGQRIGGEIFREKHFSIANSCFCGSGVRLMTASITVPVMKCTAGDQNFALFW